MTPNNEKIEGIVELVLNDRELLISKGREDGVQIGMRFVVLGTTKTKTASGQDIEIEFPKVIVKIVRFDGNLGVGRTFRLLKGTPARSVFNIAETTLGEFMGTPDRIETIKADQGQMLLDSLSGASLKITPGDPVRETRGDEFLDED